MASEPEPRRLLIIGDSASLGAAEVVGNDIIDWVSPFYVELLRQALPWLEITVNAEVHRTTSGVREELDKIIAAHPARHVLIELGSNDADMDWKRFVLSDGRVVRNRVTVEKYGENLRFIAGKLKSQGISPILTDMHNHHFALRGPYISKIAGKDVTAMLERGGGQAESDRRLQFYRAEIAAVAKDMDVPLVCYGAAMDTRPASEVLMPDGAHMAAGGHKILASLLQPILMSMIGSP